MATTKVDPSLLDSANLVSLGGLTLAAGDLLYATGAGTVAKLAKGTAGQVLIMNSGATLPEWADLFRVRAFANVTESGGSYTLESGALNISGVVKNGTGDVTVSFTTAFSSASTYMPIVTGMIAGVIANTTTPLTTAITVRLVDMTPAAYDSSFRLTILAV